MALPAFDEHGNLPPGIHAATWDEIATRFGQTPKRQRLLAGLRAVLDRLAACGCRRAWLDGSFVAAVEAVAGRAPRDFDLCWDLAGTDLARLGRLAPVLHPLRPDRTGQRRQFGGDCSPVAEPLGPGAPGLLDFFQRDRDGRAKGMVFLALRGAEGWADDRE